MALVAENPYFQRRTIGLPNLYRIRDTLYGEGRNGGEQEYQKYGPVT